MGHGIAQVSAMSGYNVTLRDVEQQFLDKAMEKVKWSLDKLVSKQKLSQPEADKIFARITPEVDKVADEKTVFASNTSTLPITEIANTTSRPERFIGIHFFNPPQLMKIVEIIPGQKTAKEVVKLTNDYVKSVKKEPVVCRKDVPGFIVNRLFIPLVHEACYVMDRQKIQLTEIDSAVKFKLGFPMGIFELADFTGMDVIHKATVEMHQRDKKVIN